MPMVKISLPDPVVLHYFPEAATLALLDAALAAVEMALRAAHPAVDDVPLDPEHDVAPSLLTAHLIVTRCSELRSLLDLYAAALRRCVNYERDADLGPF
jgi:hypothetical protein